MINKCEKCGEEIKTTMIGDESVEYCKNCKWVSFIVWHSTDDPKEDEQ